MPLTRFLIADICPELFEHRATPDPTVESDSSSEASTPSSLIGRHSPDSAKIKQSPKKNTDRPSFSYNALIAMAIQSTPTKRMTLSEIYAYICANFPYYERQTDKQWQNSVRHNLSLHKEFVKVPNLNGRGNCWAMTDAAGVDMYISSECGKLKRRSFKRLNHQSPVPAHLPPHQFQFPHGFPSVPHQFIFPNHPNFFQLIMKGAQGL